MAKKCWCCGPVVCTPGCYESRSTIGAFSSAFRFECSSSFYWREGLPGTTILQQGNVRTRLTSPTFSAPVYGQGVPGGFGFIFPVVAYVPLGQFHVTELTDPVICPDQWLFARQVSCWIDFRGWADWINHPDWWRGANSPMPTPLEICSLQIRGLSTSFIPDYDFTRFEFDIGEAPLTGRWDVQIFGDSTFFGNRTFLGIIQGGQTQIECPSAP